MTDEKKIKQTKKQRDGTSGRTEKFKISDAVIMLIIILLCLTCILPFLYVASKSISSDAAVLSKQVGLWPVGLNFNAYGTIFRDGQLTHAMGYTVLVTVLFTILGMILTICAAYPLSKKRLKGRAIIAFVLMLTMYFNAGIIPDFLLYIDLKIVNTMWVLVLPLAFSPYNMLIMRSYLQANIPDSLEEAAFLDGASNFGILWRIVLPLSKPIIATLSLFYAVGRWNAFADARYYISSRDLKPLQLILYQMVLSASEPISPNDPSGVVVTKEVFQSAAIMFATIPIMLVYPFAQKYFVKGVMVGAVKG